MKVLMVSWVWRSNGGGDGTYVNNLTRLYEEHGYEVIPFTVKHESNFESVHDKYYVDGFDYRELNKNRSIVNGVRAAKSSIVSSDALKKIKALIDEHQITFAHFHIIHHHLTPAIIWKLKKAGIPIVWTLHEYKLLCPEATFVSNGKICEKCYDHKFYNCAINKCKKQSFLASLLASLDAYFYYYTGIYKKVDLFFCPSQFLLNKFKQFKFPEEKLKLTNYCYDIATLDAQKSQIESEAVAINTERYILYVGRIEKVKGIFTLIDAVADTGMKLKIAGNGEASEAVIQYINDKKYTNITILGFQDKKSVYKLTMESAFVVCPSEWYENYPFSVIESMLLSKAVVGATIGGIPELVADNETGLLFEPGNDIELREKLILLWNNPDLTDRYGLAGRNYAYDRVNFETHWKMLKDILKTLPLKIN